MKTNINVITLLTVLIFTPYCNNILLAIILCYLLLLNVKMKHIDYNISNKSNSSLNILALTIIVYIYYLSIKKITKKQNYVNLDFYLILSIKFFYIQKIFTKIKIIIKYMIISVPYFIFRFISITLIYLFAIQIMLKYTKPEYLYYILFHIYYRKINIKNNNRHTITVTYLTSNILSIFFIQLSITKDGLYLKPYLNINIYKKIILYNNMLIISCKRFYYNNKNISSILWNRYIRNRSFILNFMKY